jgi:SAM-dependent methyltransferase
MPSFISFVPTPFDDIDNFFKLAPVSRGDVVYDLGSGDGRLLFAALDMGAGRAVGIELDPALVRRATFRAKEKGVEDRVTILRADVMEVDLSPATVVLCYLITAASAALKPKLEAELKPGARVVMESFPVHGWKAVETRGEYKVFYLYRMPPETAGPEDDQPIGDEYPYYGGEY